MFFNLLFYFLTTVIMLILTKYLFSLFTFVVLSIIFKIFYISIRLDLVSKTVNIIKKTT
jgi:hypothetical protein